MGESAGFRKRARSRGGTENVYGLTEQIHSKESDKEMAPSNNLSDLVDIAHIQKLAASHYKAAGMPIGIIDAESGVILVGVGWQDICVHFHRAHPDSARCCRESDGYIKSRILDGKPCAYKCQNGLWDIGVPILVEEQHLATLFLGQFFYEGESPDADFFIERARKFGYDLSAYLAALDRIPVFSRETVNNILDYNVAFANFVADMAGKTLLRKRAEATIRKARDQLEDRVKERTAELEAANRKLEQIPAKLIATQEEERNRLASELNDSICQTLAAVKFRIEYLRHILANHDTNEALKVLDDLVPCLRHSIEKTRAIYMGLRPRMLQDFGVVATLRWYRDELLKLYPSCHFELEISVEEHRIPQPLNVPIFRIAQEALDNVAKHSKSEWVDVSLMENEGTIELTIADDGIGMDPDYILHSAIARSLGLRGMEERAKLSGGSLSIDSKPGRGTTIFASWPAEIMKDAF